MNRGPVKPTPPEITELLREAMAHHRAGRFEEAEAAYARAVEISPDHEVVLASYASTILAQDRPKEALDILDRAVAINPDYAPTRLFLGESYRQLARFDEALYEVRRGLEVNPRYLEAHIGHGDLLVDLYRLEEAQGAFVTALELNPKSPVIATKLAQVRFYLGDIDAAEAELRRIISESPDHHEAHWVLACVCLSKHNFVEGWKEYESRWPIAKIPPATTKVDIPEWNGGELTGRHLIIWPEQGLGDELMFSTCIGDLLNRARPAVCTLVCDHRLEHLFRRTFPTLNVIPTEKSETEGPPFEVPRFDVQTNIGDLPGFLRTRDADFPVTAPAFVPDPEKVGKWHRRLDDLGPGPKIGIAWRGGIRLRIRSRKSAGVDLISKLLDVDGAHFVNLQYGDCADDLEAMKDASCKQVHHWDDLDAIGDPDDQIAQIACLDLVVQTSNASAHMAGVLGVPVWNMVPYIPEWRWLLEGEDCLWYPTMRLFRQTALGEWAPVFDRVAGELREFVENWQPPEKG